MSEPSQRSSRIAIAAGILIAAASATAGYLAGQAPSGADRPVAAAQPADPAPLREGINVDPVGRRELLEIAAAAADRFANGDVNAKSGPSLAGRRFKLRIPFGCYGPSTGPGQPPVSWSYDRESEVLRVSVSPEIDGQTPGVRELAGASVEAVEGFWVPRPWSGSDGCPPPETRMVVAPILPAPRSTVGVAEFFEAGSARASRRNGQPYEATQKVALDEFDPRQGFRLILSGRVATVGGGASARCYSPSAELRPVCIVAINVDEVAIENGASGDVLATWAL